MQVVVGEVFLDHVAPVAEADHEVFDAVLRIDLHDVPENRLPADLDHRLGTDYGLLTQARAEPPGEDHRLQGSALSLSESVARSHTTVVELGGAIRRIMATARSPAAPGGRP